MENDALELIIALKSINQFLIIGLITAVSVLENVDEYPLERRQGLIDQIKGLIDKGKKAFENVPNIHYRSLDKDG